jgi:hypothetical protein
MHNNNIIVILIIVNIIINNIINITASMKTKEERSLIEEATTGSVVAFLTGRSVLLVNVL